MIAYNQLSILESFKAQPDLSFLQVTDNQYLDR